MFSFVKDEQTKSYLFAGLAVLLWSTVSTAFKIGLKFYDPENLVLYSAFFSLLFFAILFVFKNDKVSKKQVLNSALLGLFNPFGYYLILFNAYNLLKAQEAQVLNYTWAIMLFILSIPILRLKFHFADLFTILISFFGVVIIATKGKIFAMEFTNKAGVLLAVSSSLVWALYWLLNMKDRRKEESKLFFSFAFGVIYLLVYLLLTRKFKINFGKEIFAPIYIGLFEMGVTFVLWMKALRMSSEPGKIANFIYITPFLSLVFINLILKETIYFSTLLGLIFILSGNILQKYFERRYRKVR